MVSVYVHCVPSCAKKYKHVPVFVSHVPFTRQESMGKAHEAELAHGAVPPVVVGGLERVMSEKKGKEVRRHGRIR